MTATVQNYRTRASLYPLAAGNRKPWASTPDVIKYVMPPQRPPHRNPGDNVKRAEIKFTQMQKKLQNGRIVMGFGLSAKSWQLDALSMQRGIA